MRPKSYHHGDLKKSLIQSALKIIARHGPEDLSLREAARLSGTSHAAPYRHFKDKNELLAAVAEEGFRKVLAQMKRAGLGKPPLERLKAIGTAYLLFATRHVSHFRVMFARELSDRNSYPTLQALEQETTELLHEAIELCRKEGLITQQDTIEIALALWSIVHGAAELHNNGQMPKGLSVAKLGELVTRLIATGFLR